MRLLYSLVILLFFSLSAQAQLCTLDIETSMSFDTCGMTMNVTVLDSTNGPFIYTWKKWDSNSLNGRIVKDTTFSSPYDSLNNASLGTYSVSITDANGCFAYAVFSPIEVTNIGCSTDSVYIKYLPDTTIGFGYTLADIHGYPMTKYDSILTDTFAQSTFSVQIPHSSFGTYGAFDLIFNNYEHCNSCMIPGGDTIPATDSTFEMVTVDNYASCIISSFIFSPPLSGDSSFLDKNNWIINKADTAICQSGNVQGGFSILSKKIDANNFMYSWSTGQSGQGLYSITGLSAGSYDVSITHINQNISCGSVVYPFTITSVIGTIGINLSIETGAFCTLGDDTIKTTVTGGQTLYSYLWSNNKTTPDITATQGTYTVTVTDSIGCTAQSSIYVNDETLSISIASLTPAVCGTGGAVTLTTNAPSNLVSYLWEDGNTTNSGTNLTTGLHTVVVTHDSGCVDSITIYIPNTGLDFEIDSITHDCLNNGSGSVSLSSNYIGTVNYEWKYAGINGDVIQTGTTSSMSGLEDSSYVVTATTGGCNITKSFRVYKGPQVTIREDRAVSCQSDGKLIAIANSEDATISSYSWSLDSSPLNIVGNTIEDATVGTYEVVAIDANGCTDSASHILLTYPEFSVSISSTDFGSCAATIDISGGNPSYSVQWNRATTVDSIIGIVPYTTQITANTNITQSKLPIGYYLVIATDANGCKDSIDVFIEGERDTILALDMYFRWEGEYTEECIGCVSNQLPNETQVQAQTIADNMLRQVQDATETLGDSMQQYSCDLVNLEEIDSTTLAYDLDYHHYTLYYHNRRGELVRTVPPTGVDLLGATEIAALESYRKDGVGAGVPSKWYPDHKMVTTYHYDAQGRMVKSISPDAGVMAYLYDSEGLLRFSQDARQAAFDTARYTYVLYDSLKRVVETGEAALPNTSTTFTSYLASYQNDYNFPSNQATKKEWVKSYYSIPHMRNRSTTPYYVDANATGLGNGSSWENAYTDLQTVLAIANTGDQIWVVQGTYKPTSSTNRAATFNIPSGVILLGGFDGTETDKTERDWANNLTILSGDINNSGNASGNSYHVVTTNYVNNSTLVDGFIIQDGNADSSAFPHNRGAGWYNNSDGGGNSSPNIRNCIFKDNHANDFGGAMLNHANNTGNTSPKIIGCLFHDNTSITGGAAIGNTTFSGGANNMHILNCTFTQNSTVDAIRNQNGNAQILIENSILWDSIPIHNNVFNKYETTIHTSILKGAKPDWTLGYIFMLGEDPLFVDPTNNDFRLQATSPAINAGNLQFLPNNFYYNKDLDQNNRITLGQIDVGVYEYNGASLDTLFVDIDATGNNDGSSWDNAYTNLQTALITATEGDQIWIAEGTYYPTDTTDRTVTFNIPSGVQLFGGFNGIEESTTGRNWKVFPTILSGDIGIADDSTDNTFNVVTFDRVKSSTLLDGLIIEEGCADTNIYPYDRGAGIMNFAVDTSLSKPTIINCVFRHNHAIKYGGAINNISNNKGFIFMSITGCAFYGNTANDDGSSISILTHNEGRDRTTITNCTFAGNQDDVSSIYSRHDEAFLSIKNSIMWDNIPFLNLGTGNKVRVAYSLIRGTSLSAQVLNDGNNIMNADPGFADASNHDYNIVTHSAVVERGLSNIYPNVETTKDIGGNNRLMGCAIDIGAFEHICEDELVNYGEATADSMTYHDIVGQTQRYLRNRVSYTESWNGGDTCLVSSSTYSYDPHGNVEWLRNYIPGLGDNYLAMDYDLISGNVHKVRYNEYAADAFYHKYIYDEQNRIVEVLTSKDDVLWDRDAAYSYYEHGPLQRTELGEDKVQGMDYVYTLQGWIKSVNHPYLNHYQTDSYTNSQNDPGRDSILAGQGVAKDVWAFTLGYFDGDYQRNNSIAEAINYNNVNLYNGNISHWANGANLSNSSFDTEHLTQRDFRYDDLNRLKSSTVQTTSSNQGSIPTLQTGNKWKTNYAYDPNGNITQLNRYGANATLIDELSYTYQIDKNRLDTLIDNKGKQIGTDVGSQSYSYDNKGNLVEQVDSNNTLDIVWMNTGKVRYVTQKVDGVIESGLEYLYDAAGNRITKIHKPVYDSLDSWVYTFYVRDASGNILSIYTRTQAIENGLYAVKCSLEEQLLYGSSRIGSKKNDIYVLSSCPYNNGEQVNSHKGWDIKRKFDILGDTLLLCRQLDKKQYELSDHLGNVTMTLSDRRKGRLDSMTLAAKVLSYNQFYPFGWTMAGRTFTNGTESRFAFNGQEKSPEISSGHTTAKFWEYDSRSVHRWNVDPVPIPSLSSYHIMQGNPILLSDPLGDKVRWKKNISKEDKKQMKKHIRFLRQGSKTFRKMWRDLKRSENIHTIHASTVVDGRENRVDLNLIDNASSEGSGSNIYLHPTTNSKNFKQQIVYGHELSHAWRLDQGLEGDFSGEVSDQFSFDTELKAVSAASERSYVLKRQIIREYEATHIENIIRAELGKDFGFRKVYGKMKDFPAIGSISYQAGAKGRFYSSPDKYSINFTKTKIRSVKSKTNYNYWDRTKNHYKLLKERKIERSKLPTGYLTQDYLDKR